MCGMRESNLEDISDEVKQQLRVIYGYLMKTPKVMVVRVQQQQGTVDCGLFAIMYAVSLANGRDQARVKFKEQLVYEIVL